MFLDTNAYSALALSNADMVSLLNSAGTVGLPLPVIAELRYGFQKGNRPAQNENNLQRFLAQPQVTIACPIIETTNHYAQLQLLCKRRGKALSHNDIWITALAQQHSVVLVTFDQDFLVFADSFGDKLKVLTTEDYQTGTK